MKFIHVNFDIDNVLKKVQSGKQFLPSDTQKLLLTKTMNIEIFIGITPAY